MYMHKPSSMKNSPFKKILHTSRPTVSQHISIFPALSSLQSQAHQIQRITGTNMSGNSMLMVQQLQQINDQSQQIRMTQPPQQQHPQHQPQQHSLCMQQNFLQQLHNALNNNQTKPLQPVSHFQIQLPTQQHQQHIPQQVTSLQNNTMVSAPLTMTTMTTVNPAQISQLQHHMMGAKRMANGELKSIKNSGKITLYIILN
ncbi:uncharacterized protein DDB_G0285291-like [Anneissia japonica]|uniref:uncharacterized protein DDB_G0285291-like n=1 Tax=Anneissia japonica TaxID=1529436 RepID=UPI0014255BAB|nr:uncharacterized protein DDB_G0285291-like [Anneissia japonica]